MSANSYQNKVLFTQKEMGHDSRSHQNKTTKGQVAEMTKNGCPLQTGVIFVVMDALVNVLQDEVLILHCQEPRHSERSRVSSELHDRQEEDALVGTMTKMMPASSAS